MCVFMGQCPDKAAVREGCSPVSPPACVNIHRPQNKHDSITPLFLESLCLTKTNTLFNVKVHVNDGMTNVEAWCSIFMAHYPYSVCERVFL